MASNGEGLAPLFVRSIRSLIFVKDWYNAHGLFEGFFGGDVLKKFGLMSLMVQLLLASAVFAGGDAAKGKVQYATCTACHGANGEGNPALHSPALAGQEAWYLESQIKNYQQGIRGAVPGDTWGSTMAPMSKVLVNDQAIADVVAYIQTFKVVNAPQTLKGGDATKGKSLYAICATCHGPKAEGMQALHSPRLNIQQDWYMLEQLQKFQNGMRGAHPKDMWGATMAPMAKTLVDEQAMKDVIAYIKSLQ